MLTQNYSYDAVNRLQSFAEGSIAQSYGYDARGNRWVAPGSYRPNISTPDEGQDFLSSNRIGAASYDQSGNLTAAPGMPFTFAYDGDNHQIAAVSGGNGSASYFYDAEGRRVKKITCAGAAACTSGATTVYVYDAMGQLTAEYGGASSMSGTQYYTVDHLGSTRLVLNESGAVHERLDYLPFGEGLGLDSGGVGVNGRLAQYPRYNGGAYPAVPVDDLSVKFTSKERDAETGLDFFLARDYSSAQGRFTSVDPKGFSDRTIANPQKWNRYAYVLNSPLVFIDPKGLEEGHIDKLANYLAGIVTVKTSAGVGIKQALYAGPFAKIEGGAAMMGEMKLPLLDGTKTSIGVKGSVGLETTVKGESSMRQKQKVAFHFRRMASNPSFRNCLISPTSRWDQLRVTLSQAILRLVHPLCLQPFLSALFPCLSPPG